MRNFFPEEASTVKTISDLKGLEPIPTRAVIVESFQLSVEGLGGGIFWWDESGDASLADGDTTVSSNVSGFQDGDPDEGVWRRVSYTDADSSSFSGGDNININYNSSLDSYNISAFASGSQGDFQYNDNGSLGTVNSGLDAKFNKSQEAFTFGKRAGNVGKRSVVLGGFKGVGNFEIEASGRSSVGIGRGTSATGLATFASGSETLAEAPGSRATGSLTQALGIISDVSGRSTIGRVYAGTVIGTYNEDYKNSSSTDISSYSDDERIFSVGIGDNPNASPGASSYYDGRGRLDGLYVTYRNGTYLKNGLAVESYNSSTSQYETAFRIDDSGVIVEGGASGSDSEIQYNSNGDFGSNQSFIFSDTGRAVLNGTKQDLTSINTRYYDPIGDDVYSSVGTSVVTDNNADFPFTFLQTRNEVSDVFSTIALFTPDRSGNQPILSVSSSEQSSTALNILEDNTSVFGGTVRLNDVVQGSDTSQILIRNPNTGDVEYVDSTDVFQNTVTVEAGDNVETTFNSSTATYTVSVPFNNTRNITYVGRDQNGDLADFDDTNKGALRTTFSDFSPDIDQYDLRWGDIFNTEDSGIDFRAYENTSTSDTNFVLGIGSDLSFEGTDSFGSPIFAFNSAAIGDQHDIAGSEDSYTIGKNNDLNQALSTFVFGKNSSANQRENVLIGYSNDVGTDPGRHSVGIGWGIKIGVDQSRPNSDPQMALGFFNEEFSSERVVFNYGSGGGDNDRFTSLFLERDLASRNSYLHGDNIHLDLNSLIVDKGFSGMSGSVVGSSVDQTNYSSTISDNILWGNTSFGTRLNLTDSFILGVNTSEASSTTNDFESLNSIITGSSVSGISDTFQPTVRNSVVIDSSLDNSNFLKYSVDGVTDRVRAFVYNNETIVGFSGSSDRDGSVILVGGTVNSNNSLAINGATVDADNSVGLGSITINQSNIFGIGDTIRISEPALSNDSSQVLVRNPNSGHVEYVDNDQIRVDINGGVNTSVTYTDSTNTYDINVPGTPLSNNTSITTDVVVRDPTTDEFYSADVFANDDNSVKVGAAVQFDSDDSITIGARDRGQGTGIKTISIGAFVSDGNSDYNGNVVTGAGSIAIGTTNDISGFSAPNFSYALGLNNEITNDYSVAIGGKENSPNVIDVANSFAIGQGNSIGSSEPESIQIGFNNSADEADDKQHVLIGKGLTPGEDMGTSYQVTVGKYNEDLDQPVFSVGTGTQATPNTPFYVTETNGSFVRDGFEIEKFDSGSYERTLRINPTISQGTDIRQILVRNANTKELEYVSATQIGFPDFVEGDDIDVQFNGSTGTYTISLIDNPDVESLVYTSGALNVEEDNRTVEYSLNQVTNDGSQDRLEIDSQGSAELPSMNDYSSWHFEGRVVARVDFANDSITDSTNGDSHMWKIEGALTSTINSSTGQAEPRFIGEPSVTTISTDNPVFDYEVDLDVTNSGELLLYVKGENGATVNWTSSLRVVEVIA